ncbi:MAG: DUF4340 domain-containing protein [Ruminococcus sp.]|nr:DUF4340 domain-containing protein [Ruminococcus sp.]
MKKIAVTIGVLAVLAVGSVSAALIVRNNENKKSVEKAALQADYILFSFNSDDITEASIDCEDGYYTAELIDSVWTLSNSDEFTLNHTYIQGICTYMSTLTAEKDYGEATDESKETYGLDDPTIITLSDGKNDYTIYVGDLDPTETYYYVMTEDKEKIYAIDASSASSLKATRLMIKDTYLIPYTDSEVYHVQLLKDNEIVYDLDYDEENSIWTIPDEYSYFTIDQTAITSMINVMTRCEAQEFFDENLEDYSKYGFDEPTAELIVTGSDGSEVKLLFSYYGNNTKTYTYVLYESSGQVAAFYTGDIDFIEDTTADYLVQEVCNISIYDITGFDFTYDGKTDEFSVDMENSSVSMNGTSISDLGSDASSDFTSFYNSISYMKFMTIDFTADTSDAELLMSVTLHLSDGRDTVFELYKADDDSCYIFIDGYYTGAIGDMTDLTGKNSVLDYYEELIDDMEG